jgi:cell division protein FtsW
MNNKKQLRQSSVIKPQQSARKHRPDYGLFVIASILLAVGLVVMYAISPALAGLGGGVSDSYFVTRQLIAVIIGIIAFFVVSRISLENWLKWQKLLILATIIVSALTFVMAGFNTGNRWIEFGAFSFQPVEFVKLTIVITFAGFLAKAIETGNLTNRNYWKAPFIVATILAFIILVLQKDLGSSVVVFSIALAMILMAGYPLHKFGLIVLVVIVVGFGAIMSTPYRRDRVSTFLNPTQDCANEGYHSCQALIAVGSGGLMGVGLGKSIQAYGYLPESQNDSIFAIYAEKFGFIGSVLLLALYGNLLLRIFNIMQRAPNITAMLMTAGVFTWFLVQGAINIAAMLGLIPLKGITLPFVSYGGSSLIFSMAALGLVFHISRFTSLRKVVHGIPSQGGGVTNENNSYRGRDSRPRYTVTRRSI